MEDRGGVKNPQILPWMTDSLKYEIQEEKILGKINGISKQSCRHMELKIHIKYLDGCVLRYLNTRVWISGEGYKLGYGVYTFHIK